MSSRALRFWMPSVAPDQVKIRVGSNEFAGRIKNVADGAIQLLLPVPVLEEIRLTVAFGADCVREGTVLYCNPEEEFYRVGVYFSRDQGGHVRNQVRHGVPAERVQVTALRNSGRSLSGLIVDLSASGMGPKLSSPVSTGASVK